MFAWICPRCGRENRASDIECAHCQAPEPADAQPAESEAAEDVALPERYAVPEPARVAPPPPAAPPVRPSNPMQVPLQHAAPRSSPSSAPPYPTTPKSGLPVWILLPLFTFAFIGLGAALYFGYQRFAGSGKAGFTGGEAVASAKPKSTNPLQKYLEVVGIRLTQDAKKKPQARFVAVNHGTAELDGVTANVTLWASTSRSEEDSVGTFTFQLNALGPNEAKEITAALKTKLKIYELPDWQNLTADVQITSP